MQKMNNLGIDGLGAHMPRHAKAWGTVFLWGACKIRQILAVLAQCGIRARRALSVGTFHALP
jgi:hypothetical protein